MRDHPALGPGAIARLRDEVAPDGENDPGPPPTTSSSPVPGGVRGQVKSAIRKGIAWYVDPTAVDAADAAAERVAERVLDELRPRLDRLDARLDQHNDTHARALAINVQLLKGEVRALQQSLQDLGFAIAPAAGLEAAAIRLSELRERINAVERRTRRADAPAAPSASAAAPTVPPVAADRDSGFDYLGFEQRFRGEPEMLLERMRERYGDMLRGHSPVLDVGCGRGDMLAVLRDEGIDARGVDLDADMVADAAEKGLDVVAGDALGYLRELPEGSLGAVISLHLVEHLQLGDLVSLIELARSRLRPGGLFVAETPNPASLIVLGNSYILDPTHVRPLHPSLMVFLCESAGYRDVRLEFYEPAIAYHLPLVDDPEAPPWTAQVNAALGKLNEVLFGAQEYAVIATTPD